MRKVRLALLALAVAVALPVTLLMSRALDSAAAERRTRHLAVASRTFDEMEGVLSRWLDREEARPFAAYRFYEGEAGERVRSPLSTVSAHDFVIGAFQVDPDGSVHTPLRPRDEDAARAAGDWPPAAIERDRADRVIALARTLAARPRRLRALGYVSEAAPRPESGLQLGSDAGLYSDSSPDSAFESKEEMRSSGKVAAPAVAERDARTPRDDESGDPHPKKEMNRAAADRQSGTGRASAYEVLDSLNRAASLRATRRQKVVREPRSKVPNEPPGRFRASAALERPAAARLRQREFDAEEARPESMAVAEAASPELDSRTIRIALDPMIGVPLEGSEGSMALYRTVVVDEQGYRQGLILDLDALGRSLESEVIGSGQLADRAVAHFQGAGEPPLGPSPAAYSFRHRFGEPFDALSVQLDLDTLGGVGGDGALYTLVIVLVALTGAGLFAVDRMTGVAVEFAERRNNFVAAVSHELKTPLTAIRMYGEMLRDGLVQSEEKRAEYYGTITDESERLSRLIDNVLEFSRLEKGRRELNVTAGDPGRLVHEAAERLRPHVEREGFQLHVELEPDLPPVLFDRDALLQVVFNLVDNALKYAASAERREIIIRVARVGDSVELGVRDFGPGVPAHSARRVFEPFYRGENELTRRAAGTGIGLALVRELAEAMGARVQGDAPDDGGFRVRLILATA